MSPEPNSQPLRDVLRAAAVEPDRGSAPAETVAWLRGHLGEAGFEG